MSNTIAGPTPTRLREIANLLDIPEAIQDELAAAEDLRMWADRLDASGPAPAPVAIKWVSAQKGEVFFALDETTERVLGYVETFQTPADAPPMWRWQIFDKTFLTALAAKAQFEKIV
jgi:hypothetical protein